MRMSRTMPALKRVVLSVVRGSFPVLSELLRVFSSPMVMTVCLGEVSGRQKTITIKMIPP